MQITGRDNIKKYLMNNPNAAYTLSDNYGNVLGSNFTRGSSQPTEQEQGGLGGFLKSLVSAPARLGSNLINDLGYIAGNLSGSISLEDEEKGNVNPVLGDLSWGGADAYRDRLKGDQGKILTDTLQDAAGTLAFAVPAGVGGTGLKGALKAGALSGGLSGFSQSDLQEGGLEGALRDTLTGATVGAGTSGAFYGLGEAINKAKGAKGITQGGTGGVGTNQPFNDKINQASKMAAGSDEQIGLLNKAYKEMPQAYKDEVVDQMKLISGGKFDPTTIADESGGFLSNIGKKLRQKGEDLEYGSLGIGKGKTVTGFQDQKALQKKVGDILKTKGVGMSDEGIGKAYNSLADDLTSALNKSKSKFNTGQIFDDFTNDVALQVDDITKGAAQSNISKYTKQLAELGDEIDAKTLASFKKDLQKQMSPIYKKLERGNPLTDAESVRLSLHNTVDRVLKEGVPEAKNIYSNMSALHQAAPDIVKATEKAQSVYLPFTLGAKVPTGGVQNKARQIAGRTLQRIGDAKLPQIPQQVQNLAGSALRTPTASILQQVGSRTGGALAPYLVQQGQQMSGDQIDTMLNAYDQMSGNQGMGIGQMGSIPSPIELAAQGYTIDEIEEFQKILQMSGMGGTSDGGGKKTEKQAQFANAAQSAQDALDLLDSGDAGTGKLRSVQSGIEKFFGTQGSGQTDYESRLALARGLAMNALAGANISPSEAQRVADAIPELTDEPEIAKQKLRSFIEQMLMFGGSGGQEIDQSAPSSILSMIGSY